MRRFPARDSMMACLVFVTAAAAALAGCASGPDAQATVGSMGGLGVTAAKAKDSIDDTLRALEALAATEAGDLALRLESYARTVAALDQQAEVVRGQADEMKARGDAFFEEWEGEASSEMSPERRAQLSASYARIKEDMVSAREEFTPFLASLKDIERYLSLDPSLKAISDMAPLVKTAKETGGRVKSRIDAVLLQVNSVRGMLATPSE